MSTCAYCGKDSQATREEVLPLFLSRSRPTYRTIVDNGRKLVRRGIPPPVKDVCESCNGVVLSALDSYAANLDRVYFQHIVGFYPEIEFKYNFDRLLRWLLKIFYNDDRTRPPPYETRPQVPFILGEGAAPLISSTIFLGLITPTTISDELQAKGFPSLLKPELCSVGYSSYMKPAESDIIFGRFIQINSYFLNVIGWRAGVSRQVKRRHTAKICQQHTYFELRRSDESVFVSAPAMDFLTFGSTFLDARLTYRDIRTA
jgi:hypothetical protein